MVLNKYISFPLHFSRFLGNFQFLVIFLMTENSKIGHGPTKGCRVVDE
jgi:hypothetical protein